MKERIKKYFTEKPEGDFWMWAFITLLIFRYVSPLSIMFIAFFSIGLVAPGIEGSQVFENASTKLVEAFIPIFETMYNAGSTIGTNNPLIAKILFFGLSNIVWVIWIAMIALIFNLLRYGISWIIRKKTNLKPKLKRTLYRRTTR